MNIQESIKRYFSIALGVLGALTWGFLVVDSLVMRSAPGIGGRYLILGPAYDASGNAPSSGIAYCSTKLCSFFSSIWRGGHIVTSVSSRMSDE